MKWLFPALVLLAAPQLCLAENEVAKGARNAGIGTCQKAVAEVSNFVLKDAAHGSHNFWNKASPQKRMFESVTIKSYSDNNAQIVLTATPTLAGSCDISIVETSVMSGSCLSVRDQIFSGWKYAGEIQGTAVLVSNNGILNAYLTPQLNNSACLVSKREGIFGS